jgi:hypothetical protein
MGRAVERKTLLLCGPYEEDVNTIPKLVSRQPCRALNTSWLPLQSKDCQYTGESRAMETALSKMLSPTPEVMVGTGAPGCDSYSLSWLIIVGAIRAPYYLDGVTDPSSWATQLNHPAPWGEIGSSKFAVASPKDSLVAMVTDTTAVTAYWDKVRAESSAIPPVQPSCRPSCVCSYNQSPVSPLLVLRHIRGCRISVFTIASDGLPPMHRQ